jgi:hypothetical protein
MIRSRRSAAGTGVGNCRTSEARRAIASTIVAASLPGAAPRRKTSCGAPERVRTTAAVTSPKVVATDATDVASARGFGRELQETLLLVAVFRIDYP